jgi:hypothetical protein
MRSPGGHLVGIKTTIAGKSSLPGFIGSAKFRLIRTWLGRHHSFASHQFHQHLSDGLAIKQLEKHCRRFLDALFDRLLPGYFTSTYPP